MVSPACLDHFGAGGGEDWARAVRLVRAVEALHRRRFDPLDLGQCRRGIDAGTGAEPSRDMNLEARLGGESEQGDWAI